MLRFPIGFHTGPGGNPTGIGDFMRDLDNAGIHFYHKAVDDYGVINEAITNNYNATLTFRLSGQYDVPDYSKPATIAAEDHWNMTLAGLPPEFVNDQAHKDRVWLEVINEVDKNRAEWLAEFAIAISNLALADGFKIAMFAWSAGEPEPEHWRGPQMLRFLRLAAANRSSIAIALHEYSLNNDLFNLFPYLVGRFEDLLAACDENGIGHPSILITEFGWQAFDVPPPEDAMPQLAQAAELYCQYDEILGAAIWYLGGGFNDIANKAQRLIEPTKQLALNSPCEGDSPPPIPGDCIDTDDFERHHILRPRTLTSAQWDYIKHLMEEGVPAHVLGLSSTEDVIVGYEGWSHLDAMGAIKRALAAGYFDSRLIVVDGHEIGTGFDAAWMEENCPLLAPYTVYLRSDGSNPVTFEFKAWPTDFKTITQYWGANPQTYQPFNLPGHEGVDIKASHGSNIYAVADGYVSQINLSPSGHNYGIFVRIRHAEDYETTYAHLSGVKASLVPGQAVKAGDVIGYADNTGNSFGNHLHITLKRLGHVYTDEHGTWPHNIHDPEPFMIPLCPTCFDEEPPPPPASPALLGLHTSADPALAAGELASMQQAKVEVIKVLSSIRKEDVTAIANAFPNTPTIIRAFLDFGGRDVEPNQFLDWTWPDVNEVVNRLGNREIWVELHNEPNLFQEGLGASWANGVEFNTWLQELLALYRSSSLPQGVKYLYPGLSPGGSVPGIRMDSSLFLDQSIEVARMCDGVALHNYWSQQWPMNLALAQIQVYINRLGSKPMWVTEASNNKIDTPETTKASQYIRYVSELAQWPNIRGVTYFVASASNPAWGWGAGGSGEVWLGTDIPLIVGSR